MWLQFTRRTHYQITFISYPKISSKVRLMCTTTMWENNHHTTLRVENNQSRRRPTSWSLSKLPDSGLYLQLLSRGRTFPLALSETYGPIVGKSREKVEPLSLTLPLKYGLPYSPSSFFLFLFLWITLNRILKRRKLPPSFLHATCPFLDFFLFLFIFRSLHFSINTFLIQKSHLLNFANNFFS